MTTDTDCADGLAMTAKWAPALPRHHLLVFVGLLTLAAIGPLVAYPVFLMKIFCFALFACAFNLLLGFGGLMSFGHAAYFGAGAYVTAHAAKVWGVTPEVAILLGTATATLLGLCIGALAIRRQGIYFAMITLAFAQMVFFVALQAPFTGGEDGIQAVPRGRLFGLINLSNDITMYVVVVAITAAGIALIYRTIHSPFGQALKAIRDNEPRAISLGYRVNRYKLLVFVLSAGLAGLAGSTKTIVFRLASLSDVHWAMSGEVVLMTLLGGLGTIFGPIVGAAVVVSMHDYLGSIGSRVIFVQGAVFVACVIAFRQGIVGLLANRLKRGL
jgi:branched-chain amino acid transport system permease protein